MRTYLTSHVESSENETESPRENDLTASSADFSCPRTAEILSVLNDVFDSFSVPTESGILSTISPR